MSSLPRGGGTSAGALRRILVLLVHLPKRNQRKRVKVWEIVCVAAASVRTRSRKTQRRRVVVRRAPIHLPHQIGAGLAARGVVVRRAPIHLPHQIGAGLAARCAVVRRAPILHPHRIGAGLAATRVSRHALGENCSLYGSASGRNRRGLNERAKKKSGAFVKRRSLRLVESSKS